MNIIEWVKNLYKRVWRSLDDTPDDIPVVAAEPEVKKTEVVKKKKPVVKKKKPAVKKPKKTKGKSK